MNKNRNLLEVATSLPFVTAPLFLVAVSACAQRHRNPAPDQMTFNQQTTQIIRLLSAAEEVDQSNARDPRISMVRREDFFEQADKAERAIRELLYGYEVAQSELAALAVPPKSLSPQVKADLIRQLQGSIALNDLREQNRLSDYVSATGFDSAPYDTQKAFAAAVIRELNIGDDVHWDTLQQALQVPQSH
jgi:hypothetical protein